MISENLERVERKREEMRENEDWMLRLVNRRRSLSLEILGAIEESRHILQCVQ